MLSAWLWTRFAFVFSESYVFIIQPLRFCSVLSSFYLGWWKFHLMLPKKKKKIRRAPTLSLQLARGRTALLMAFSLSPWYIYCSCRSYEHVKPNVSVPHVHVCVSLRRKWTEWTKKKPPKTDKGQFSLHCLFFFSVRLPSLFKQCITAAFAIHRESVAEFQEVEPLCLSPDATIPVMRKTKIVQAAVSICATMTASISVQKCAWASRVSSVNSSYTALFSYKSCINFEFCITAPINSRLRQQNYIKITFIFHKRWENSTRMLTYNSTDQFSPPFDLSSFPPVFMWHSKF